MKFLIPHEQRTTVLARIVLLIAVLLGPIYYASAQEKSATPSKDVARDMLARAAEVTDLRAPGSASFHLRSKAKSFGPKGGTLEGTYEIWWVSPDQWREEINWAGISYVEIADRERLWRKGDDVHRFDTLRLLRILSFGRDLKLLPSVKIESVRRKKIDGIPASCIEIPLSFPNLNLPSGMVLLRPLNMPDRRIECLQAATSLPLRMELGSTRMEFENYMELGPKRFPRRIRKIQDKKTLVEVEVELAETLSAAPADLFAPPTDAVSRAWCSSMVPPKPLQLGGVQGDSTGLTGRVAVNILPSGLAYPGLVVFDVNDKGRTVGVEEYDSGGRVSLKDSTKRDLLKFVFQPATCQGISLEAEYAM